MESKRRAPLRTPCDLGELVANVVAQLDESRARRITLEARDAGPYPLLGDAAQLERCITNLLTNALKYSGAEAPVLARLSRNASDVQLEVVDRGIGIAPDHVEQIFDRYYRTAAGTQQAEGLGLGLYIARLIVEAHGGRIDVVSTPGEGSTFRLSLPLRAAPP